MLRRSRRGVSIHLLFSVALGIWLIQLWVAPARADHVNLTPGQITGRILINGWTLEVPYATVEADSINPPGYAGSSVLNGSCTGLSPSECTAPCVIDPNGYTISTQAVIENPDQSFTGIEYGVRASDVHFRQSFPEGDGYGGVYFPRMTDTFTDTAPTVPGETRCVEFIQPAWDLEVTVEITGCPTAAISRIEFSASTTNTGPDLLDSAVSVSFASFPLLPTKNRGIVPLLKGPGDSFEYTLEVTAYVTGTTQSAYSFMRTVGSSQAVGNTIAIYELIPVACCDPATLTGNIQLSPIPPMRSVVNSPRFNFQAGNQGTSIQGMGTYSIPDLPGEAGSALLGTVFTPRDEGVITSLQWPHSTFRNKGTPPDGTNSVDLDCEETENLDFIAAARFIEGDFVFNACPAFGASTVPSIRPRMVRSHYTNAGGRDEGMDPNGGFLGSYGGHAVDYYPICLKPPAGLVAWWPGDVNTDDIEGDVDTDDIAWPRTHPPAMLDGNAGFTSLDDGYVLEAYTLDGNPPSSVSTGFQVDYAGGVTFDAWIRVRPGDPSGLIMSGGGGINSMRGMGLFVEPDPYVPGNGYLSLSGSWEYNPPGYSPNFTLNTHALAGAVAPINDDAWHHVAATWTGDTTPDGVRLYLDGAEVMRTTALTDAAGPSTDDSAPLGLGGHTNASLSYLDADIDEADVFSRALDATEIKGLFDAHRVGKCKAGLEPDYKNPYRLILTPGRWSPFFNRLQLGIDNTDADVSVWDYPDDPDYGGLFVSQDLSIQDYVLEADVLDLYAGNPISHGRGFSYYPGKFTQAFRINNGNDLLRSPQLTIVTPFGRYFSEVDPFPLQGLVQGSGTGPAIDDFEHDVTMFLPPGTYPFLPSMIRSSDGSTAYLPEFVQEVGRCSETTCRESCPHVAWSPESLRCGTGTLSGTGTDPDGWQPQAPTCNDSALVAQTGSAQPRGSLQYRLTVGKDGTPGPWTPVGPTPTADPPNDNPWAFSLPLVLAPGPATPNRVEILAIDGVCHSYYESRVVYTPGLPPMLTLQYPIDLQPVIPLPGQLTRGQIGILAHVESDVPAPELYMTVNGGPLIDLTGGLTTQSSSAPFMSDLDRAMTLDLVHGPNFLTLEACNCGCVCSLKADPPGTPPCPIITRMVMFNRPPVCNSLQVAYPLDRVNGGPAEVALTGFAESIDADGDLTTFAWSTDCPGATFTGASGLTPSLELVGARACPLACNVTLTVMDPYGAAGVCTQPVQGGIDPPRQPDLIGWWPFEEACGGTTSDIAGAAPGQLLPAAGGPARVNGMVGGALAFDGLDDHVEVPGGSLPSLGTGDVTIDAWIRAGVSSGVMKIVDYRQEDSGPNQGFSLFLGSGVLGFQLADGDGSVDDCGVGPEWTCRNFVSGAPRIDDGTWHHVAVAVDRDQASGGGLYIDGVLSGTFDPTQQQMSLDHARPLRIGTRSDGSGGDFAGDIDEVQLYTAALSQTDIQAIHAAGHFGKCKQGNACLLPAAGTVGWWPGDGHASDIVGGNDGTLENGTGFTAGPNELAGRAFSLDGQDDVVRVPYQANLDPGSGSFSVEAWMRTNDAIGIPMILEKFDCFTNSNYSLYLEAGMAAFRARDIVGVAATASAARNLADGHWHHLAGVRDVASGTLGLFVDGDLAAEVPAAGMGAIQEGGGLPDPLRIGAEIANCGSGALHHHFSGEIDEVRYHDRALGCDEVAELARLRHNGECKPAGCLDGDLDGYGAPGNPACPNGPRSDCDDTAQGAAIHPGATEVCNGVDDNCDPVVAQGEPNEADMDEDGSMICEGDCNDNDDTVYPGAPEVNDGKDNHCAPDTGSGLVDEIEGEAGFTSDQTFCWRAQEGATTYQVVRSLQKNLDAGCTSFIINAPVPAQELVCLTDTEVPPGGEGFFYLVRPLTPFAGSWGWTAPGVERTGVCGSESFCLDGQDNDANLLTDCADPNCNEAPYYCPPRLLIPDDGLDNAGATAIFDYFQASPASSDSWLVVKIEKPGEPAEARAFCTNRASNYRSPYLSLAKSSVNAFGGNDAKQRTSFLLGTDWSPNFTYRKYKMGAACSGAYSWCTPRQPDHPAPTYPQLVLDPAEGNACEAFIGTSCAAASQPVQDVTIRMGHTRLEACEY